MKRKRVRHWRKFGAAAVLCAVMLLCGPATSLAFKSETHVYISQQILNDVVPDGKVTIEPFGEFIVDPAIVEALRSNPSAYRMGAIGPDAFPDIVGGQMAIHPGTASWPSDLWLKKILEAARDARQKAFAYGFLGHAAGDMFGHTYINTYAGGIFRLQENQEVVLRHIALEEYIKDHTPPIIDHTGSTIRPYDNSALDVPAEFLRNVLLLDQSVAGQYGSTAPHLKKMYEFWSVLNAAVSKVDRVKSEMNHGINELIKEINSLQAKIDSIKKKTVKVCIKWIGCKTFKVYPAYCFLDPGTCLLLESTEATLALTRAHLELARSIQSATVDATAAPIIVWKKEVEEAIKQYIITSGEVAKAIMNPAPNTDPQTKLRDWACRYAPVFTGVPNEAVLPGCAGIDFLTNINNKIESLRSAIRDKLGFLSWAVSPSFLLDDIQNEVKKVVTGELSRFGFDLAGELTGPASTTTKAVALLLQPVTAASLNETFSGDTSGVGLLIFDDVVNRVNADMHLSGGYFDPVQFNAVYNSAVLSKLALLGPAELNRLVRVAGWEGRTVYGADLYSSTSPFNVLFGAVRSLDGNQPWQEYGIPYPRREGFADVTPPSKRNYGYSFDGSRGFRLWQDCDVRERVFLSIFRGPNAPALEAPFLFSLPEILPPGDPNRAGEDDPFLIANGSMVHCTTGVPTITASVDPAANDEGWHTSDVKITFTCDDASSGIASCTGPITVATDGADQVFTGTAINNAGKSATVTVRLNIDKTPPEISAVATPAPNAPGWNNTEVTVHFICTDATSGVASCPEPVVLSSEGAGQTVTGTAADAAGNTKTALMTVNIDRTPPSITGDGTPEPNENAWNNTDVVVAFTCDDALSGVAFCTGPVTVTTEGEQQTVTGTARDQAGNMEEFMVVVNIDKTPPALDISASPSVLWPPNHKLTDVSIAGAAQDALSGVDAVSFTVTDEYGLVEPEPAGFGSIIRLEAWREGSDKDGRTYRIRADVADQAGNRSTAETEVLVPHDMRARAGR